MKLLLDPKFFKSDKLYGTTTIGARGQVVIPAQARKDLKLKPGDRLMVAAKVGKVLSLFKADQMGELIKLIMEAVARTPYEQEIRKYVTKTFGNIKK